MAPAPIDFDTDLDLNEEVETIVIKLFGREWRLQLGLNAFNLSALTSGDASAIAGFVANAIHPDDRDEFKRAISMQANLTPEKLGLLINKLIEVMSGRPTTRPSVSRATASKRTSTPKSGARS